MGCVRLLVTTQLLESWNKVTHHYLLVSCSTLIDVLHSCPSNNTGLNCVRPLTCRSFFTKCMATGLHDLWLVECTDVQPQIHRADSKVIIWLSTALRVRAPNPRFVQGSTVLFFFKSQRLLNIQLHKDVSLKGMQCDLVLKLPTTLS